MPYYQQGPEDYYGPQSGFDPFSGRLDGGGLVMAFMNQLQAIKQRKQEEQWAIEDRELNRRVKEAQIKNYEETANPPKESETELKWRLYTEDPEKFRSVFGDPNAKSGATTKKITTTKGSGQLKIIDQAAKRIASGGQMYRAMATQLGSNPMNSAMAPGKFEEYKSIAEAYEKAAAEIEAMKTRLDENGELEDKDYARLQSILKVPEAIRGGATKKPLSFAPPAPAETPVAISVPEKANKGDRRTINRGGIVVEQVYNGTKWLDVKNQK